MNDAELEQATRELNDSLNEVVRYMNNRSDFFIVNVGAFEVRFNLANPGKPKEEGGAGGCKGLYRREIQERQERSQMK